MKRLKNSGVSKKFLKRFYLTSKGSSTRSISLLETLSLKPSMGQEGKPAKSYVRVLIS